MGPCFGCERSGATFLKSTGMFAAFFIFGRENSVNRKSFTKSCVTSFVPVILSASVNTKVKASTGQHRHHGFVYLYKVPCLPLL